MSDTEHTETRDGFWAIIELMGHVRIAGFLTEESRYGAALGRVEIPGPDATTTTQWFGGGSIYRVTPTTQAIATQIALASQPAPVHLWELSPASPRRVEHRNEDDLGDEDG